MIVLYIVAAILAIMGIVILMGTLLQKLNGKNTTSSVCVVILLL